MAGWAAVWLAAGGSILAGRRALSDGWAANIGGGFHHAQRDRAEGFRAFNDIAIAGITLGRPVAVDAFADVPGTGTFLIVDATTGAVVATAVTTADGSYRVADLVPGVALAVARSFSTIQPSCAASS